MISLWINTSYESSQEVKIGRIFISLVEERECGDDIGDQVNDDDPQVGEHKPLHTRHKHNGGADDGSQQQLHRQNTVDLAQEGHSYFDRWVEDRWPGVESGRE